MTGSASVGGSAVTVAGTEIYIADADLAVGLTIDADTGTSGVQTSLGEDDGTKTVRVTAALASGNAPAGGLTIGLNAVGAGAVVDDGASFETGEDIRVAYPSGQSPAPPSGHGLAVHIPAAMNSGSATLAVVLNDDGEAESGESLRFEGGDVTEGSDTYKIVAEELSITDNDAAPTGVDLTLQTAGGEDLETVGEAAGTVRVRVRAAFTTDDVLSRNITIPLTVGEEDDTAAAGTDYEEVSEPAVTIEALQGAGTAEFDLAVTEDTAVEGGETVTVHAGTLSAFLTGLGLTAVNSDSLTITDNDLIVSLLDAAGQPINTVREGASSEVTVRAAYPEGVNGAVPRVVRITVRGTGAASGTDYVIRNTETKDLLLRYGQNSVSDRFTLDTTGTYDDNIAEGPETLQVTAAAAGFSIPPNTLTIIDNDTRPTGITLTAGPGSISEGQTRTVTVTARLNGTKTLPTPTPVTISIPGSGSTASGSDYRITNRLTAITIPAAASTGTGTFTIAITADAAGEPAERINIAGTAAGFTVSPAVLTIPANTAPAPPPPPSGGGGGGGAGGGWGEEEAAVVRPRPPSSPQHPQPRRA